MKRLFDSQLEIKVEIDEKIGTYGKEGRDPRGKVISTAYRCTLKDGREFEGEVVPLREAKQMNLAFDHKEIIKNL